MKIHYSVIGCGEHALRGHIEPAASAGMFLAGVYDTSPAATELVCAAYPATYCYPTIEDLFDDLEVEATIITSPDRFHPEQLLAAVTAGKHVLVDKPLALDDSGMGLVRQALHRAAEHGVVVTSCHPRRFDPPYVAMKTMLPDLINRFGKVMSVQLNFSYHASSADWKQNRSLLMDHFPHEIDYLHFLLGRRLFSATKHIDGHDRYTVTGVREDGVTFFFAGTRRLGASVYPEDLRVRFERGECGINTKTGALYIHDDSTSQHEIGRVESTDYKLRFGLLMQNFADTIAGSASNYLTQGDLLVNTESAIALARSGYYSLWV